MSTDNTPTDPTTHDRLRAALERLVDEAQAMRGNHGHRRTCDRDHSAVPNPSGTYHSCRTLTDAIHDARAALATPAPAADEARCGWMQMTDFDRDPLCVLPKGHDGDHKPAPTPAPTTPPATERCQRMTLSGAWCGRPPEHIAHRPQSSRYDHDYLPTPPATEPVAALVSDLKRTILRGVIAGDNVPVKEFVDASNATHRLALLAAVRAEDGLAEDRDRWKAEAEHQYALRASSGTLDGAWAEVERALPDGWWLHSIYQRYFGDEVGYTATAHGGAGLGLQGNGSTPVEALRSLATNLREHPDDR